MACGIRLRCFATNFSALLILFFSFQTPIVLSTFSCCGSTIVNMLRIHALHTPWALVPAQYHIANMPLKQLLSLSIFHTNTLSSNLSRSLFLYFLNFIHVTLTRKSVRCCLFGTDAALNKQFEFYRRGKHFHFNFLSRQTFYSSCSIKFRIVLIDTVVSIICENKKQVKRKQ